MRRYDIPLLPPPDVPLSPPPVPPPRFEPPPPPPSELELRRQAYEEAIKSVPQPPQPSLWRDLVAGALEGFLGRSSFGGLAKPLAERIRYGDYVRRLAQAQQEIEKQQALLTTEQKEAARKLAEQAQTAQIAENEAQARYYRQRAKPPAERYQEFLGLGFSPEQARLLAADQPISSGGASVVNLPDTIAGSDLANKLERDMLGNPIDPDKHYRAIRRGDQIVGVAPVETAVRFGAWRADPESPTGYSRPMLDRTGKVVSKEFGIPSPEYYPSVSQRVQMVTDAAGNIIPVPVVSSTQRAIPEAQQPRIGAAVGRPGEPIGRRPVTDKALSNYQSLNDARRTLQQLFELGDRIFTTESGPLARTGRFYKRVGAELGLDQDANKFISLSNALKSTLAKVIGRDVGNLSIFEQQWASQFLGNLGNTASEWRFFKKNLLDILDHRIDLAKKVVEGKLDEATALDQQQKHEEQVARRIAGPKIIVQRNRRTGEVRWRYEGEDKWRSGEPPKTTSGKP